MCFVGKIHAWIYHKLLKNILNKFLLFFRKANDIVAVYESHVV